MEAASKTYDGLGRVTSVTTGTNGPTCTFTYTDGDEENETSTQVSMVTDNLGQHAYTYDGNGNILTHSQRASESDTWSLSSRYEYDSLNQLTRVDDAVQQKAFTYSYDSGGNILEAKTYAYTTDTLTGQTPLSTDTYTYGSTDWKDLLTSYNGGSITYDGVGNPMTYYDGATFTWTEGRKLAGYTKGNTSITYEYDGNGLRSSKTVNGVKTSYRYIDGMLYGEYTGNQSLTYQYDDSGRCIGFIYNNGTTSQTYYYLYNLQGDVTAIFDASGNAVAKYTYDAWGKIVSITDGSGNDVSGNATHIGNVNPIRYKGYYYDAETGFYYVSSRYYDPEVGRFISADDVDYLGSSGTVLSYNMYAYCENNPVNMIDADGHAAIHFAFAAIGGLAGWKLGDYVAKKLGYRSGKKYWAIRAGVTIGGAVIGWFSARLMTQILTGYLRSNPSLIFKMSSKWGVSKFNSVMSFLGINPFNLSMNSSKFIGIARLYNSKSVTLGYNWAISLYNKAKSLGFKVMLDKPHGGYGWHIHLSGSNGKLSNLHIQISKAAWDYLSKRIK